MAMDAFILPSMYEGLPVVCVEAQAAGLSCVVSKEVTREIKITKNVKFIGIDNHQSILTYCLVPFDETAKKYQ